MLEKTSTQQYRNLVFKGGGVRGVAYMGAVTALEENGLLPRIERVAGTSAGAIAALLLSFRLPVSKVTELFNRLDLSRIPQHSTHGKFFRDKIPPLGNTEGYRRLIANFGWHSSEYFYQWGRLVIADHCQGNAEATFLDFKKLGYRDLFIVASNLSCHRAEIFSVDTTPGVAVADAVRMSMSIPLYFEALRFDGYQLGAGDYYVDGGLYNNYPIHIFDHPKYARSSRIYSDGINWETLGLFLYPDALQEVQDHEIPENIWEFVNLTVRSIYDSHQTSILDGNLVDRKRTVRIGDCGISPLQFDLQAGSKLYQQLYQSGYDAVNQFLRVKQSISFD